jgi:DNA-binding response OmpR family regulator
MKANIVSGPVRILAVDPAPSVLTLAGAWLLSEGYDVVLAGDGAEALALLQTGVVDLLLSELDLPDTHGIRLCQQLRRWHGLVPVLFMGENPGGVVLRMLAGLPRARYLPKPLRSEILVPTVNALLVEGMTLGQRAG